MAVEYTQEQQDVIDSRNCNLLVSAAAGSGKTAVLVERIIQRLLDKDNPLSVDELLVVTFTKAAAAEMKERVYLAIEKQLEEHPDDAHLQEQATLVHSAKITTIDGFCKSVVSEHFHEIDLEPGFRVADEGEIKLLKQDVVSELLEQMYQKGEKEFLDFVECYTSGSDDRKIEEIILALYQFTESHPDMQGWLRQCASAYDVKTTAELMSQSYILETVEHARNFSKGILASYQYLYDICDVGDGPQGYTVALQKDMSIFRQMVGSTSFEEQLLLMKDFKSETMRAKKEDQFDPDVADFVKESKKKIVEKIKKLKSCFFYKELEGMRQDLNGARQNVNMLVTLLQMYDEAFRTAKRQRAMIDFADMEHYALEILTDVVDGERVPSATAKEYQEMFAEIMIDEYQDSNLLQEAILTSVSKVSQGIYNIFMVGDVKQSIYRFRSSRPELFMEKYDTYTKGSGDKQRIDLHKNFRSRKEVLESTNYIFRQIMTKGLGGIEYDDDAALYPEAKYHEAKNNQTEVLIMDEEQLGGAPARDWEVRMVAMKIKELMQHHQVQDKKTGELRALRYSDIVILLNTMKGWSDDYTRVLNKEGIPTYAEMKSGYFQTLEITQILNYLRVLDNPCQDIPLVSTLTGMFGNITNEELAIIKSRTKRRGFYQRLQQFVEEDMDPTICNKINVYLETLQSLRARVPYMSIYELITVVLEETGYGDYMAAMPNGEQRQANLEVLLEKAIAFEQTSYKGLFHFVRYIEQLQKYDVDYGEANLSDEQANVVQIMSIHKSKGLEFPIVIVGAMGKGFNMRDNWKKVVVHPRHGIGVDFVDYEERLSHPVILRNVIKNALDIDTVSEQLRVLYVAMTRAKEKLILAGTIPNLSDSLEKYGMLAKHEERQLPYTFLEGARTFFDWIIPALYRNQTMDSVKQAYEQKVPFTNKMYLEDSMTEVRLITREMIVTNDIFEETKDYLTKQKLLDWDATKVYDEEMKQLLEEQMSYQYPHTQTGELKRVMSVSELKKRAYMEQEGVAFVYQEEEVMPLYPNFVQEEKKVSGAERGTAYHSVMEFIDFKKDYDEDTLREDLMHMVQKGVLTSDMAAQVKCEDILYFLQSNLGQRMRNASVANCLHEEQPFILGVPVSNIYPETTEEEMILVQGIIDAYFEEEDGLVVMDYKTDRVAEASELVNRYRTQLDYYAQALEQITGKQVKEKRIYSFALRQEIEV